MVNMAFAWAIAMKSGREHCFSDSGHTKRVSSSVVGIPEGQSSSPDGSEGQSPGPVVGDGPEGQSPDPGDGSECVSSFGTSN